MANAEYVIPFIAYLIANLIYSFFHHRETQKMTKWLEKISKVLVSMTEHNYKVLDVEYKAKDLDKYYALTDELNKKVEKLINETLNEPVG